MYLHGVSWLVSPLVDSAPFLILRVECGGRDTCNQILDVVQIYVVQCPTFAYTASDLGETVREAEDSLLDEARRTLPRLFVRKRCIQV